jgi:GNAT superfamily N-acetyltransferase
MQEPLRIEFNQLGWPGLAEALEAVGLSLEANHPVMVCPRSAFTPVLSSGVSVDLEAGHSSPASRVMATGTLDGRQAGVASLGGVDGIAELYGVFTEPAFRRRGVASTLSSAVIRWWYDESHRATAAGSDDLNAALSHGAAEQLVFLEAETAEAAALYRKIGFVEVDRRLLFVDG